MCGKPSEVESISVAIVNQQLHGTWAERSGRHLMGEEKNDGLQLDFDQSIRLVFVGSKITSDA